MYRLTTISEHLLQDIVDELKKNNELLSKLISKSEANEEVEVITETPKKRSKKGV
jgi:hypothetical protein